MENRNENLANKCFKEKKKKQEKEDQDKKPTETV